MDALPVRITVLLAQLGERWLRFAVDDVEGIRQMEPPW